MQKTLKIFRQGGGRYRYELKGDDVFLDGRFRISAEFPPDSKEEYAAIKDKLIADAGHSNEAFANLEVVDDA